MKDAFLSAELETWPSQEQLVSALRAAGLQVQEGWHSVRISNCEHFVFQSIESKPRVDADASSESAMIKDAMLVSAALSAAGIKHRFEVYGPTEELAGYFHHQWPAPPNKALQPTGHKAGPRLS